VDSVSAGTRALVLARGLTAGLFVAVAVASIAQSLPIAISSLEQQRRSSEGLTDAQRATAWESTQVSRATIAFYRRQVKPGQRFYVQAPSTPGVADLQSTARVVTGYALLPSVSVSRPSEADVVVSFHADPRRLPLRYTRVVRLAPGISVATVAHGG
jgi:hypothetical protein